jgi:hypothetical protein
MSPMGRSVQAGSVRKDRVGDVVLPAISSMPGPGRGRIRIRLRIRLSSKQHQHQHQHQQAAPAPATAAAAASSSSTRLPDRIEPKRLTTNGRKGWHLCCWRSPRRQRQRQRQRSTVCPQAPSLRSTKHGGADVPFQRAPLSTSPAEEGGEPPAFVLRLPPSRRRRRVVRRVTALWGSTVEKFSAEEGLPRRAEPGPLSFARAQAAPCGTRTGSGRGRAQRPAPAHSPLSSSAEILYAREKNLVVHYGS